MVQAGVQVVGHRLVGTAGDDHPHHVAFLVREAGRGRWRTTASSSRRRRRSASHGQALLHRSTQLVRVHRRLHKTDLTAGIDAPRIGRRSPAAAPPAAATAAPSSSAVTARVCSKLIPPSEASRAMARKGSPHGSRQLASGMAVTVASSERQRSAGAHEPRPEGRRHAPGSESSPGADPRSSYGPPRTAPPVAATPGSPSGRSRARSGRRVHARRCR